MDVKKRAPGAEIRIVIADDHPLFRRGLRQTIEAEPHLRVIGEVSDGEAALACLRESGAVVAILDVDMPEKDGFDVARAIQEDRLPVEVIFLTFHQEEQVLNDALALGVKGYVLKDSAVNEIVDGIRAVAAGQNYVSPALSTHLIKRPERAAAPIAPSPDLEILTPTERRVLKLIAAYKTNKEIARELFVSARTVQRHRENTCEKLGLKGPHALLQFAVKHQAEL